MIDPPSPGLPPLLLQVLARLVWAACPGAFDRSGAALGAFGSTALYFAAGEVWASGPPSPTSPVLGPFLLSHATAEVIQRGTLATDGSMVYGGARYRVQALTENGHNIARAIVVS